MLDSPETRREAIKSGLENLVPVLVEAYLERDWAHFGYSTWNEYLSGEYAGVIALPRDEIPALREAGLSTRAIAAVAGVSKDTVSRVSPDTPEANHSDQGLPPTLPKVVGLDGKQYDKPPSLNRLLSTNNEWYTPPHYVEAARRVMGGIDLDPASCAAANEAVQASLYYSEQDDGLSHSWKGNVWLNPPYGGLQKAFVAKAVDEYRNGEMDQCVILVSAHSTETKWFRPMWDHLLCFTDHRIDFYTMDNREPAATHGSVFVYLGENQEAFAAIFGHFGNVMVRYAR